MIDLEMISDCGRFRVTAKCEPKDRAMVEKQMRATLADRVAVEDAKSALANKPAQAHNVDNSKPKGIQ